MPLTPDALEAFQKMAGGGSASSDPYARFNPVGYETYKPENVNVFQPGGGNPSSFSDWLRSLPTPQQTTPGSPFTQSLGPNIVPAIWQAFAPYGESLINKEALARFQGGSAGIAGGRREFERSLLAAFQGAGMDPILAKRQLAESAPQVGERIQALRGETEANRLDQLFGLTSGIQNALAQSAAGERDLISQLYLASKGREAARSGAQSAMQSSLLGGLLNLGGSFLGGPAFGAGGTFGGPAAPTNIYHGWGG